MLALVVAVFIYVSQTGSLDRVLDKELLVRSIESLGAFGPLLVIALMTLAIVMSPIPSAPIALAAGAAYGHLWGAVYVAAGSLSGALIAFGIARFLGREFVEAKLKNSSAAGYLDRYFKSQNALTATVFATRLMPFLSFDVISYAAGLTPLATWRFAVATVAGIVPASFLLAHFGGELASTDGRGIVLIALVLGLATAIPLSIKFVLPRVRKLFR
tara:strand:- start:1245 stop:1889 length:645 start_codon:yes stop_codon:yes gene_type:complete